MLSGEHDSPPALGAQLWIDPQTPVDELLDLVDRAHRGGLTVIRLMLLWPLVEPTPGVFRFEAFDAVIDACAERGMQVWMTLSPESRPWHHGVGGLVQSAPEHMPSTDDERSWIEPFLVRCVSRYRDHPALGRWIAWNEPQRPGPNRAERAAFTSEREKHLWVAVLQELYGDVDALNQDWLTGFASFAEVPHPTSVLAPGREQEPFANFGIWLAECRFRARCLAAEVAWVREVVSTHDPHHEVVINLPGLFDNLAGTGYDLTCLADSVDVLGASIHAPWHLGFASRPQHPAYIAAGMGLLRAAMPSGRIELTEVQGGSVITGAPDACDTSPEQLVGGLLAAFATGSESGITWALNARRSGFEAGDWGMLDDATSESPFLRATRHLHDCLSRLRDSIGQWRPAEPTGGVLVDESSMAVELVRSAASHDSWGTDPHHGIRAAGSLVVAGTLRGHPVRMLTASALDRFDGRVLVVPHALGLSSETLAGIETFLRRGGRVVLDAESLRFDERGHVRPAEAFAVAHGFRRARLHQPRESSGLGSSTQLWHRGHPTGHVRGPRAAYEFIGDGWRAHDAWTIGPRHDPVLHESKDGALTLVTCALGGVSSGALAASLWDRYLPTPQVIPLDGETAVWRIEGDRGPAYLVAGSTLEERDGADLALHLPVGVWHELWSDEEFRVQSEGTTHLAAPDGLAILVPRSDAP